jgi:hypothetical protein
LPYSVTLNSIIVQAMNKQIKELGWWKYKYLQQN